MSTIVTRIGKGSPLTWIEVDDNFTNLNNDKIQSGNTVASLTITSATINGGSISGITDLAIADGGTGASTAANARTNLGLGSIATQDSTSFVGQTGNTTSATIPNGTTAQRDASPSAGYFRFNSSLSKFEGYNGTAWGAVGGGATGGGGDEVFVENSQVITTSYTITSGKNAMSTGTLTINSGVTVTVPSGSRWVVL